MKVLFHTNTLNYRGTSTAVIDYATYNQSVLGNESFISYDSSIRYAKDFGTEDSVVNHVREKIPVLPHNGNNIKSIIRDNGIDVVYFINGGGPDKLTSEKYYPCKSAVHAVFKANSPHGDSYAYVSEWLSKTMSNGTVPFVPHIVKLPEPNKNIREEVGVPEKAIVLGRIGGYATFDIPFAYEAIRDALNRRSDLYFMFIGTRKFIDHPRVLFINEIHDFQKKSNYINACDAMIHARQQGESFGLSIGEFLYLNKPVIAHNGGSDRNHLEMLKNSGLLYNNKNDLLNMILNIESFIHKENWKERVKYFSPENVMKKFNQVFLT